MPRIITDRVADEAMKYLAKNDTVLAPIIARAGPCPIRAHTDYYWELVDAIISQQLSVRAAASIEKRFQELFGSKVPPPESILEKSIDELRSVGLSRPKANYIHDLAQHILGGKIEFDKFEKKSNTEIATELTAVKGIGQWTADMFLMFCLGRTDVLPVGDLGIRNSIRELYGFDHLPTAPEIQKIASQNNWAPYESCASWYIWQNLDNTPKL